MRKRMLYLALAALTVGCTTVEPGKVGIKVNLYGSEKGVSDYPLVTGVQFYNPFTTTVYEYPTFVQTTAWDLAENADSPGDESITFNSKEGLPINVDISLSYQVVAEKVPNFFVKFRNDKLHDFTHGFMRNTARDAFNEVGATYGVEDIYGPKKEELIVKVTKYIDGKVTDYGVQLVQFGFLGRPRLPKEVEGAITAKIQATQMAIARENELRTAEAEARKKVATSEGLAKSRVAEAEGEARANELLARSLSSTLLQWKQMENEKASIEKWNGALPAYMGGQQPVPFLSLDRK